MHFKSLLCIALLPFVVPLTWHAHHIVLMGDSVMRYQYLSLVFFLEYSQWPGGMRNGKKIADPTWENLYVRGPSQSSWTRFFQATNSLFDQEVCDCFRAISPDNMTENRYYFNKALNVHVTFINWSGDISPHGHVYANGFPLSCRIGDCSPPYEWAYDVPNSLLAVVHTMQPRPSYVFLNVGLWVCGFVGRVFKTWEDRSYWDKFCSVSLFMQKHGTHMYWAGTTMLKEAKKYLGADIPELASECRFKLFDRYNITKKLWLEAENKANGTGNALFVDQLHFKPPVYKQLNLELCDIVQWPCDQYEGSQQEKIPPLMEEVLTKFP